MIEPRLHASRAVRIAFWLLGSLALVLGIAGVFLPVLPTTPFVLLAAFCYSRASLRFHALVLENRVFGPLIREWHATRTIPRRAKCLGLAMMAVSFTVSIMVLNGRPYLQIGLAVLGLGLGIWMAHIPSRAARAEPVRSE
jgi:uncharacterized membrane protein YbaN (DUF454 family)